MLWCIIQILTLHVYQWNQMLMSHYIHVGDYNLYKRVRLFAEHVISMSALHLCFSFYQTCSHQFPQ